MATTFGDAFRAQQSFGLQRSQLQQQQEQFAAKQAMERQKMLIEQGQKVDETLASNLTTLADQWTKLPDNVRDSQQGQELFNALLQSNMQVMQAAQQKGVPTTMSPDAFQTRADLIKSLPTVVKMDTSAFLDRATGKTLTFNLSDPTDRAKYVEEQARRTAEGMDNLIPLAKAQLQTDDPSSLLRGKGATDKAKASAEKDVDALNTLRTGARDVTRTPGAFGLMGAISESVGGVAGQIPVVGETLQDMVTGLASDSTPEEISAARFKARSTVSQMLSAITGEESGRFTEAERAIAEQALKSLTSTATEKTILGAYSQAANLIIDSAERNRKLSGQPPLFDLSTEAGIDKLLQLFIKDFKVDEQTAERMVIERMTKIR